MQTEEYKDMFYGEAKEHIDKLNNNLLTLEKEPSNHDVINELFRAFHTLKGNSATMGYEKFSKVAHKLEDVLDMIRNEKLQVDKNIMDTLFFGCDILEKGLEKINENESENFDETDILMMLETIVPSKKIQTTEQRIEDKIELTTKENEYIKDMNINNENIKRVIIEFEENQLKSAKAQTIIKKLTEQNKIIRLTPNEEDIKNSNFKSIIEIVLSEESQGNTESIIKTISKIKSHKIMKITDSYSFQKIDEAKTKIVCEQKEEIKKIQDVRIDIKRLDNLMNMVGELLIYKMNLENINKRIVSKELETVTNSISLLAQNIQNEVIEERMIPLGSVFSRLPRIVRDLAKEEQKEIEFIIEGDENSLDRTVIDKITDPLIHMVRNSVDHGIEMPSERETAGKDKKGTIMLSARR